MARFKVPASARFVAASLALLAQGAVACSEDEDKDGAELATCLSACENSWRCGPEDFEAASHDATYVERCTARCESRPPAEKIDAETLRCLSISSCRDLIDCSPEEGILSR